MSFQQFKLTKSINQSRGIFDKYIYMPDNGDLLATITADGYFSESRYIDDPDWVGSIIEIDSIDGYTVGKIKENGIENLFGSSLNPENLIIERLFDGESLITNQSPSALDTPKYIQFGVVQGDENDPIQTIAQGADSEASILRINQTGTYRLKLAIQYGRSTASGTAIINFRALINGVQAGRSVNQRLQNANQTSLFTDETWITLPAGIEITYEVIRDSNGDNSGGLIAGVTSGSTGWNAAPSCALRVERWRNG